MNDDFDLLKKKDTDYLKSLVDHYTDHLFYLSLKKGLKEEQAEELVQDVWLRFFDAIDRFEGKSTIKTFLLGIYFNVYKESIRSFEKERKHDSIDEIFESHFDTKGSWSNPPISPESEVWGKQLGESLDECLDSLDYKYREAFLLKEVLEETTEKICNLMKIQSTHLGVLLFRARAKIRECIEARI